MSLTLEESERAARAQGFDTLVARQWAPHPVLDLHRHDGALRALKVSRELWLSVGRQTTHLPAGAVFAWAAGVLHAARYGPQGATVWVARRAADAAAPGSGGLPQLQSGR